MFQHTTVDSETFSVLREVSKVPFVRNQFALAGGTSLALQTGHRISIDLVFFPPVIFAGGFGEFACRESAMEI